ncbi:hypothetical protein FB451DRAFT_1173675 [Mycena latifolia]|nr:hypothetical protein FB451DRAFT_1173675 [Mycena latifolia]
MLIDMALEHQEGFDRLQSLVADENFHAGDVPEDTNMVTMDGILDGSERSNWAMRSEFGSLEQDLEEDSGDDSPSAKAKKVEDWRMCRDWTDKRNQAFLSQMPEIVNAYIHLCAEGEMLARPSAEVLHEDSPEEPQEAIYEIPPTSKMQLVWEWISIIQWMPSMDDGSSMDRPSQALGLMPSVPWHATVVFKIHVLEAYCVTHVRCPQLAIQSFVKALCDIYGMPYWLYLCQFSIAYDLYLDIQHKTDECVMNILGCDSTWRLKHACPACMYKLEGDDKLIFDMLIMMDSNDSLKRVLRREKWTMEDDKMGKPTLANLSEQLDNRNTGDGYFISREKVEKWAKTRMAKMLPMQSGNVMWGIFDESGIFLALCHHGFILVIADMIRSGELAKYLLVVIEELLDTFNLRLGAGYDIRCHFEATVANSRLGDLARERKLKCLVRSFHGHTHNRLCQLGFLAMYIEGMGLEDLEGCEHFFSHLNGLTKSCRYASRFHRQQEISLYTKHFNNFEMYANLRKFLCSNYRQALMILKTEPTLKTWMCQEGVASFDEFHQWLQEEKTYLMGLKRMLQTNIDTLKIDCLLSGVKYNVLIAEARHTRGGDGMYAPRVRKAELARWHGKEKLERDFEAVEDLEWVSTAVEIKKHKYQLALGQLELLIVEHIFELTKTNQSQTGYKMRKHIAKALQARSKAVKTAIGTYNTAAQALDPPMPTLGWDQVMEYAFLADFDILRDTNKEIRSQPWTRPAYQLVMDCYFRILCAHEEIQRLNVEIPQVDLVTWIVDENCILRKSEEQVEEDIRMAAQLHLYRECRGHFDDGHMWRFWALAKTPRFTASLWPSVSLEQQAIRRTRQEACNKLAHLEEGMDIDETLVVDAAAGGWRQDKDEDDWEDADEQEEEEERAWAAAAEESDGEGEGEEAKEQEVSGLLYRISMLAVDDRGMGIADEL